MQVDLIYIPYDFTMEASACNKSPIQRNTTIQDPGRPYPPSLVMDFKREVKCISVRLLVTSLSSRSGEVL